jgi:hypothetical protein
MRNGKFLECYVEKFDFFISTILCARQFRKKQSRRASMVESKRTSPSAELKGFGDVENNEEYSTR